MTAGVIHRSVGRDVVWTMAAGIHADGYPPSTLSDLDEVQQVLRLAGPGAPSLSGVLPSSRTFNAVALINHNLSGSEGGFRFYAFSGPGNDPIADAGTMVYDSGFQVATQAPVLDYRPIRPLLLPSTVTARSFHLFLNPGTLDPVELGGVEIGTLWAWPGISYGREQGILDRGDVVDLSGGGNVAGEVVSARVVNAQVDLMKISETSTSGLDFQKGLGLHRPFVFSPDFEDPSTWARQCIYGRNKELPPMVGALYRRDRFPIRIVEHMR